jgi:hypothetical protein
MEGLLVMPQQSDWNMVVHYSCNTPPLPVAPVCGLSAEFPLVVYIMMVQVV